MRNFYDKTSSHDFYLIALAARSLAISLDGESIRNILSDFIIDHRNLARKNETWNFDTLKLTAKIVLIRF